MRCARMALLAVGFSFAYVGLALAAAGVALDLELAQKGGAAMVVVSLVCLVSPCAVAQMRRSARGRL